MDASAYGQTEIADYLRSHGAVDWRDTTPPDFKAGHERLLEHMIKRFGPLSDWSLELKQAPGVTLHLIEANKDSKFHTFFTIGLSDRRLPHPGDKYATCELRFRLSKKWRYTTRALANPKFNWPFVWLEKFVSDLIEAQQMPSFPIIIHDDPPAPLGVKTELSHWLCLHSMGEAVPVRDCRWIDIYDLHPVYAEEASFVREHGHEDFAMKMHEEKIPIQIDPKRKNICK